MPVQCRVRKEGLCERLRWESLHKCLTCKHMHRHTSTRGHPHVAEPQGAAVETLLESRERVPRSISTTQEKPDRQESWARVL